MEERDFATEAAAEVNAAVAKATEIAAATAEFTAAAATDRAAFYIDCTKRVIKLCDDKRKEVQTNLADSVDM